MKESDIRPDALFKRYLELSARDADVCFARGPRVNIACVACGDSRATPEFDKLGFAYSSCHACGTLYQSPRPSSDAFEAFYRDSESSRYWSDVFFPAVAEARRERIFRPRVDRMVALCEAKGQVVGCLADVGAGYGMFLEEWRARAPHTRLVAIEPSAAMAETCRTKGFEVVEDVAENVSVNIGADLVVCFEVLEHVHDPLSFMQALARLAKPGGYVFISTLGVDGFDIQMLWEKSNSISPPHHLNFLSVAGFEQLFTRAGLTDVEVTTPGQLDVDIVRNAARATPSLLTGQRFLTRLLSDDDTAATFQKFLAENQLSSHTWIIGRNSASGASL